MRTFLRDLLYGVRIMARNPGVAALAILALALGIGANTAIFSVVDSVLLRSLPYPDADRLMHIWGSNPARDIPFHFVFYSDVVDWRQQSRSFESVCAYAVGSANLITRDEPEQLQLWKVNAEYFPMLGASFVQGRGFRPEEDAPGAAPVAILSHRLWQRRFASDPKLTGQTINLDGIPYTVVGVLPPRFSLPGREVDAYSPLALPNVREARSNAVTVGAYGRLRPGVTKQQAQAEMETIGQRLARAYTSTLAKDPKIWGFREFMVRDVRLSLCLLMAAVGLVLLIACVNVANLLLARSSARKKEIAVRTSLGASRGRLIRQMLTESCLLGFTGGSFGILFAWWGVKALVHLVPERFPMVKEAGIDGKALLFTLAVSLATGFLFGLAPALLGSRSQRLTDALKEGGRGDSDGSAQNRMLSLLVVAEVALALILLVCSGLMMRSFHRLNAVDPGFRAQGVLTASITLPHAKYGKSLERSIFFRDLLQRLETLPGVRSAGVVSSLPLTHHNTGSGMFIEGRPIPPINEVPVVWFRITSAGYFRSMDVPLVRGRYFDERDDSGSPPVAIINSTLARRFWPNEDPVGRRVTPGMPPAGQPVHWITIVGVVGDLRHKGLGVEADGEIFYPYQQDGPSTMTVTIRVHSDPQRFSPVLRNAVAGIDREMPVSQIRGMEQILIDSIGPQRFSVLLLGVFAAVALILAVIGIYGVVSFSVTRRIREIGVRMALGARPDSVLRMVVGKALALAIAGILIGLAAALSLTRVISSILFGVSTTDPVIIAGVAVLLAVIAALAGFFPALRASRIDPIEALRHE